LAIASCRLLGGSLDAVMPTAASLELYHNAFLVHDDVQDGSTLRRGQPSLPTMVGVPMAVAVGDGMLALAMQPLLENFVHLGTAVAARLVDLTVQMARIAAEGQATELAWIRHGEWRLHDRDYLRMVYKKSAHYSFVTPLLMGGLVARGDEPDLGTLGRFGAMLGIAFQIKDDLLSLQGDPARHGKRHADDLWEGKRTLPLLHALRVASEAERASALTALAKPRAERVEADVEELAALIARHDGIAHGHLIARRHCARARGLLDRLSEGRATSGHLALLDALVEYVVRRER
jgi:geranylgeranyl diphosphate synthase type II